jgi:mannonate dehydratase
MFQVPGTLSTRHLINQQEIIMQAKLKLSLSLSAEPSADDLAFAQQLGVQAAYIWVRPEQRDAAFLTALRHKVEDAGIELYMVGNMNVGKSPRIHLALPGRDEDIAAFQQFVRNLGQAGIGVTTFTWEPDQVWSSAPTESRGARARHVDLDELAKQPYTHGRAYSEDELWDNFAYFMERIIPVAEDAGVRLALHPNDPPAYVPLGGVPCLIKNAAAYRRAFEIADSPALGMEFCMGCWLEGGEGFGDILEGIREFQADGRILIVHFRNVSSPLPVFTETFLDNGYMDMYQIMKTLVETDYAGTVTLDHTPHFAGDYAKGAGSAYAIGYMRALIERAEAELGG